MTYADVTFEPGPITLRVAEGTSVLDAGRQAGLPVAGPCGGRGTCGKCRVQVEPGGNDFTAAERASLDDAQRRTGWHLACQIRVGSHDLTVRVPEVPPPQLVKGALSAETYAGDAPIVTAVAVEMPPSTLDGPLAAWDRLQDSFDSRGYHVEPDLDTLGILAGSAGGEPDSVTGILHGPRIVALVKGPDPPVCGLALDIGTTTLAAGMVDLATGRELAIATALNPQSQYGADIISRIDFAGAGPDGLKALTGAVRSGVNDLIGQLVSQAGIGAGNIYAATVVGNTCMLHLLAGISPRSLAVPPFTGVIHRMFRVEARLLDLDLAPAAPVIFLPALAGYAGADTVGVILATGIHHGEGISLAVDIGTNGEIVLGSRQGLLACSAAAGPAFEGADISSGMRAAQGAVERVVITPEGVTCSVIGGGRPVGICGSGLIDAVAGLLDAGVIDETGRLLEQAEAEQKAGPCLAARVKETERGRAFLLTEDVLITQRDIRQVQVAKAAIQAGIGILRTRLGCEEGDIGSVLLAGSFGNYINKPSAVRLGLCPPVPAGRIRYVGNAAHEGAKMLLLNRNLIGEIAEITRAVKYVELSANPEFSALFTESMHFDSALRLP